ncbi:MAG: hypothetical protein IH612_21655 [Desulfofustis sp.]|nr:hypothetical protein [Desulfofustis sp.]
MKHLTSLCGTMVSWALLLVVALLPSSCSRTGGIETISSAGITVIDLAAPGDQLAQLETIQDQGEPKQPLILKIPAGHRLPVYFTVDTPFAASVDTENILVFKQDVFVLVRNTSMAVSPDSQRWAAIDDLDAVKHLFGVSGGEVSIGMSAGRDRGALIEARVILRQN